MQLAARSSIAAGVAVLGAGALVAAPVAPPMPDMSDIRASSVVRTAAVELSALAGPITALSPTARATIDGAGVLGQRALQLALPDLPALAAGFLPTVQELVAIATAFAQQFGTALADTPAKLQLAIGQIGAGQITAALNTIVEVVIGPITGPILEAIFSGGGPLVDLVELLQRPFEMFPPVANVIGLLADPDFLLTVGLGPLQSIYQLTTAIGGAAEGMLAAVEAGDPAAFVGSLTKGVGDLTEAVIDRLFNPGTPPYGYDRGLIASLVEAGKMIIAALTAPLAPPAVAEISATTTEAATTVTLSTDPAGALDVQPVADVETTGPVAEVPAETVEVTPEVTEEVAVEDVVETEEETPVEKPEVREGVVAIPGEVTVGVPAEDAAEDTATETDSSGDEVGSAPDAATGGADTETSGAGAGGDAGDSDGSGSDGSDSGSGSGGGE